jgi:hypothetical protein
VELALQKKRQAKQPVVKIQKPESTVAVTLVIPWYVYVTREEVLSRKQLEWFSTETSLYLNIAIFSHVALCNLLKVNIDVLEEATVFVIMVADLMKETASTFETSVFFYRNTPLHISEDNRPDNHHRENPVTHVVCCYVTLRSLRHQGCHVCDVRLSYMS